MNSILCMFSDIADTSRSAALLKKARIERACDVCRKKKTMITTVRCDGVEETGKPCTHCMEFNFECTFLQPAKKRGRPRSYVESLEHRIEKLEKIIQSFCPNDTVYKGIMQALAGTQGADHTAAYETPSSGSGILSSFFEGGDKFGTVLTPSTSRSIDAADKSDEEDDLNNILADSLKRMQLEPPEYRFLGKSSGLTLIRTTLDAKNSRSAPVNLTTNSTRGIADRGRATMKNIRMEYWMPLPWEIHNPHMSTPLNPTLPEPDLALHLIDLYFRHMNIYLPLMHRPTFMKLLSEKGLITSDGCVPDNDDPFRLVYLLVCAVGARYSDDPRCLLDGVTAASPHATHSNGWKWFHQAQAQAARRNVINPPTLFDIQFFALAAQFLIGSSAPQAAWTLIGFGVRVAQDVGAHRKKTRPHLTAEEESLKRAFWQVTPADPAIMTLVCMDSIISASFGRACAIHDEDFDLDLPIDCDDEYWNTDHPNPSEQFKQPKDKPSLIASFITLIKLNGILGLALRTIYSTTKTSALPEVKIPSGQTIVAELDSALNKFADSVPEHLKWDPAKPDEIFFTQSASLYSLYYHVQILVHRSFIPSPTKSSMENMPSLAMCANAARSCCRIVESVRQRGVYVAPEIQMAVFTSAMVLSLSIWQLRLAGAPDSSAGVQRDIKDVYTCMQVLQASESRWHIMGRLWDILRELVSASDVPPKGAASGVSQEIESSIDYFPHTLRESRNNKLGETYWAVPPPGGLNWTSRGDDFPSHGGHNPLLFTSSAPISVSGTPFLENPSLCTLPTYPSHVVESDSPLVFGTGLGADHTPYNLGGSGLSGGTPIQWDDVGVIQQRQSLQVLDRGDRTLNPHFTESADLQQTQMLPQVYLPAQLPRQSTPSAPGGESNQGDLDLMSMWSNAPDGFRLEEWNAYLQSVGEIMYQSQAVPTDSSGSSTL